MSKEELQAKLAKANAENKGMVVYLEYFKKKKKRMRPDFIKKLEETAKADFTDVDDYGVYKVGSFLYSLGLDQLALAFEKTNSFFHFFLYGLAGCIDSILRNYIMRSWEYCCMLNFTFGIARNRVHLHYPVDLISKEFYSVCIFCGGCRENIKHIPSHSKSSSFKVHIISKVLHAYQIFNDLIPVFFVPEAK